nr:hypothetical protein Iba_chr10eCG7130 [Ipomoea batatas]
MLQATVASTARRRHQATAPPSSPLLHVLKLLIPPHADTTSLHCLLSCSPVRFPVCQICVEKKYKSPRPAGPPTRVGRVGRFDSTILPLSYAAGQIALN